MCNQEGYCTGQRNNSIAHLLVTRHRRGRLLKNIFGVKYPTLSQGTFDSAIRNFNIYGFSIDP
jgi:hypothetical protein